MSPLLDEVRALLVRAAGTYAGSPGADVITALQRRLDEPLRVAIAGKVKAGKSTLLNALTDADVAHEVVTYAGAPHSFFDRKQEEFQSASDDAWQRTLDFIARHA